MDLIGLACYHSNVLDSKLVYQRQFVRGWANFKPMRFSELPQFQYDQVLATNNNSSNNYRLHLTLSVYRHAPCYQEKEQRCHLPRIFDVAHDTDEYY